MLTVKRVLQLIQYRYKRGQPTGIRKALSDTDCHWWEFRQGEVKLAGAPYSHFPKITYAYSTIKYIISFNKLLKEIK